MLHIDGSIGEGGGQILRTALSLSLITGRPFRLSNIRAGRKKPGLMRQHLVCVHAAQTIGQAIVTGADLGSTELTFIPGAVKAGDYHFAIGSAGSTMLVLQTVLPVLLMQEQASTVRLEGGTHNPMAPTVDFIQHGFLPAVAKMGITADVSVLRSGFFPLGGGEVTLTVQPWLDRQSLTLLERGDHQAIHAKAGVVNLEWHIAERELKALAQKLDLTSQGPLSLYDSRSQGNAVMVEVVYAQHTEVFTALGEVGKLAEQIARGLVRDVKRYLAAPDAVDEHLADQLLLPMALGCGGQMSCRHISDHTRTQAAMIERFLPVRVHLREDVAPYTAVIEVVV